MGSDDADASPDSDPADADWFDRFSVEPVAPATIERRLEGAALATLDVPAHLNRTLVAESETGTALYRLVQLFGTPNVPGVEAGGDQRERYRTTWQYLFDVSFDDEGLAADAPTSFLLSVYDYRTDLSVGLSTWVEGERGVREPTGDVGDWPADVPPEPFLEGVVELALNVTEEPVPATFKELWV